MSAEKIEQLAEASKDCIKRTPLFRSLSLERKIGAQHPIYIKAENLQFTGSFKVRGAFSKIMAILPAAKKNGVVAASAGNHAQGVAFHARRLGLSAKIVMPETTPIVKTLATRELGAEVVLVGDSYQDAYARALEIQKEEGREYVHAFDDEDVIFGQATLAVEILEQCPDVKTIFSPIGGGGLMAGMALYLQERKPDVDLIAVQAEGSNTFLPSREKGSPVQLSSVSTIAEGMAVRKMGELPFKICNERVAEGVVVSDEEIAEGVLWVLEKERLFVEGCGGAAVAAVLKRPDLVSGPTVIVLSGGNLDVNILARIIERGLVKTGRRVRFEARLADVPGSLEKLIHILSQQKVSILHIDHERVFANTSVKEVTTQVQVETTGEEHVMRLKDALHLCPWPVRFHD